MMFRRLPPLLGSDNLDIESNRVGWERASTLFSAVFSLFEAGLVLGLLRGAAESSGVNLLWVFWSFGYLAVGVYILNGSFYLTALLFGRLGWGDERKRTKRSFRIVSAAIALAVPYIVDLLTSQLIVDALG
jgi:hypothetical protein